MHTDHLISAVYFLRRVIAGKLDEDRLLSTVDALEREILRRKQSERNTTAR
jgi:hypothetical protein